MNDQSMSIDIKTESIKKPKSKKSSCIITQKNRSQSNKSKRNSKTRISKSKFNLSQIETILGSPKACHNKMTKFLPKDCKIQCSDFGSNALSSDEEESEMGKGLNSIGIELKQRIIGMGVGINKTSAKALEKFKSESNSSEKNSLIKHKKKKNKKVRKISKNFEEDSTLNSEDKEKYRFLKITKHVFDSMDEEEIINDLNEGNKVFEIDGNFIFIFDSLILFSSLFSFFYIPISIAKNDCFCNNENIFITYLQIIIEVLYYLDIVVTFFRGYYDYEFKLNKNNKQIAIHYLKHQFKFDLIEAIPFISINNYLCNRYDKYKPDGEYCLYNGINGKFIILKLMNCLKIVKIMKSMAKKTNVVIYTLFESVSEKSWGEKYLNILYILLFCFLGLNIFVCLHIFVGKQSYPNWIILTKKQNASFSSLYITSLYFLLVTFTTVGYGDIYCSCMTEYIFQIILLSVGIIAYSYLITIIGDYFKNETRAKIKHEQKLTLLEEIRIEYPKMPFKLYRTIHQHLESLSHQQKKCDFNILVNSLPYAIKNLLLFKVYDTPIKNFHFLKDCDNSDFISKVLTSFIPVFSKKNAFIIHEDEIVENIVFVKEGSLSLKVAINLYYPEECVRKILYEKFVDIPDNFDRRNSIDIANPIRNEFVSAIENKNAESAISNKQGSLIEQEIGKVDLGCEEDLEDGNYQFLKILNIAKNDYYGMIYMFLNKPSPLSLRVRSKKADIFLLRKHDCYKIAKAYPNIWKKQFKNSFHNMISIKKLTFKVLGNYCRLHNIIITKTQTKETGKIALSKIQEMIKNAQEKNLLRQRKRSPTVKSESCKKNPTIKSRKSKKFGTSLHCSKDSNKKIRNSSSNQTTVLNLNEEKIQQLIRKSDTANVVNNKYSSEKRILKAKSLYSEKLKFSSSRNSFLKSEDKKIEEIKTDKNEKKDEIINNKINEEKSEDEEKSNNNKNDSNNKNDKNKNDNSSIENYQEMLVEKISTEMKKVKSEEFDKENDKEYYKSLSMKLIESLTKLIEAFNQMSKDKVKNINNINNIPIISTVNTYLKLPDSIYLKNGINTISSLIKVDNSFSSDKLSISTIASFNFKPSYKNFNEISNGNFIHNKSLQEQTQYFIRSFITNLSKKNYIKKKTFNELNDKATIRSSSVKPKKSDIYKNIDFDVLKQKNIVKEVIKGERRLTNHSFYRFNKFAQKINSTKIDEVRNRPKTIDKQNNIKLKVVLSERNSTTAKKRKSSEIEYEFPNIAKKEIWKNISDILDKNKDTKKKINFKRSSILEEIINSPKKDNNKINANINDNISKKNMEKTNDQIKEIEIKKESNKNILWNNKCNIY